MTHMQFIPRCKMHQKMQCNAKRNAKCFRKRDAKRDAMPTLRVHWRCDAAWPSALSAELTAAPPAQTTSCGPSSHRFFHRRAHAATVLPTPPPPRRSRARRTPRPRRAGRSEAHRRIRPCLAVDLVDCCVFFPTLAVVRACWVVGRSGPGLPRS